MCILFEIFYPSLNIEVSCQNLLEKSLGPTKPDLESTMFQLISSEKQYHQKLEVGKIVSTLLNSNEDLSEESLTAEYKKVLKLYPQSQVQHVPVHENAMLKPWQNKMMTFIQQPTHREVICVSGQQGSKGKTSLQNYIKYHHSDRRVITTDIATGTKDIGHYLSKFPLECKDIFLFNHPCSTAETIVFDLLEGIKDGYKVSAKYDTRGIFQDTLHRNCFFKQFFKHRGYQQRKMEPLQNWK